MSWSKGMIIINKVCYSISLIFFVFIFKPYKLITLCELLFCMHVFSHSSKLFLYIFQSFHLIIFFGKLLKFLVLSFTPSITNTTTIISTKPYALFGWGIENGGIKYTKFSFLSCMFGWENRKLNRWRTSLFGW